MGKKDGHVCRKSEEIIHKKLLEAISEFRKAAKVQINMQNSAVFLYTIKNN